MGKVLSIFRAEILSAWTSVINLRPLFYPLLFEPSNAFLSRSGDSVVLRAREARGLHVRFFVGRDLQKLLRLPSTASREVPRDMWVTLGTVATGRSLNKDGTPPPGANPFTDGIMPWGQVPCFTPYSNRCSFFIVLANIRLSPLTKSVKCFSHENVINRKADRHLCRSIYL